MSKDVRAKLGELPRWDLSDLYVGAECETLSGDLDDARMRARTLNEQYAGMVADLSGEALGAIDALAPAANRHAFAARARIHNPIFLVTAIRTTHKTILPRGGGNGYSCGEEGDGWGVTRYSIPF